MNPITKKYLERKKELGRSIFESTQKSDILATLEAVKGIIEEQKTYTGGSSVNEKDRRINKSNLLRFIEEAEEEILKVK